MKKNETAAIFTTLAAAVLLACGCASPKIQTTEAPNNPVVAAVDTPTAQPTPVVQRYTVQTGDSLWAIAKQTGVYSDSFQWPEIFKTDRDQIQDPDQITPGQVLTITQGLSDEQVAHARKLASDTPKFVPHENPRSPLPIDYF